MPSSVAANKKLSWKRTGIMTLSQNCNSGSALPSWDGHWLLLVGTSALTITSGTAIIAKRTITLRDLGCHASGLANAEQGRLLVPSFAMSDGSAPRRSPRSIMHHRRHGMKPRPAARILAVRHVVSVPSASPASIDVKPSRRTANTGGLLFEAHALQQKSLALAVVSVCTSCVLLLTRPHDHAKTEA
jgi:hypothetical protein